MYTAFSKKMGCKRTQAMVIMGRAQIFGALRDHPGYRSNGRMRTLAANETIRPVRNGFCCD